MCELWTLWSESYVCKSKQFIVPCIDQGQNTQPKCRCGSSIEAQHSWSMYSHGFVSRPRQEPDLGAMHADLTVVLVDQSLPIV